MNPFRDNRPEPPSVEHEISAHIRSARERLVRAPLLAGLSVTMLVTIVVDVADPFGTILGVTLMVLGIIVMVSGLATGDLDDWSTRIWKVRMPVRRWPFAALTLAAVFGVAMCGGLVFIASSVLVPRNDIDLRSELVEAGQALMATGLLSQAAIFSALARADLARVEALRAEQGRPGPEIGSEAASSADRAPWWVRLRAGR